VGVRAAEARLEGLNSRVSRIPGALRLRAGRSTPSRRQTATSSRLPLLCPRAASGIRSSDHTRSILRQVVAPVDAIFLDAKLDADLVELDEAEAPEMREMNGLDQFARVCATLGLHIYLTAGPKESRPWTIRKSATAPAAAGVVHSDFQRGFIKGSTSPVLGVGSSA